MQISGTCETERVVPAWDAHVVVTGTALITSAGATVEECWRAIREHTCTFRSMPDIESPLPSGSVGSQAVSIEFPTAGDSELPALPREAAYLRHAIMDALGDAGLPLRSPGCRRMLVLGTTLHGIRAGGRFLRNNDPAELRSFLANATSGRAVRGMDFRAGTLTTCSACSSGLGAVALAATVLRAGVADIVVAGGYDPISEYAWAGFNSLRLVAQGNLRPFARGREGMKLGEGYAVLVLERESEASARGARVHACIAGWGESADAHHLTQPLPTGAGAARAMRQALARAAVEPGQLGLVVAHATGTPDNDASESAALSDVLGEARAAVPVTGLKSHIGHTLGGAGAVELVLASCALKHGTLPTCRSVSHDEIECTSIIVATGPSRPARINATMNSSLGFGGANTSVVLTSAPRRGASSAVQGAGSDVWITGLAVLSAASWPFVEAASSRPRAPIDESSFADLMSGRRARRLSSYAKYTIVTLARAIADAGLSTEDVGQASAILASMHGSPGYCSEYYTQIVREGVQAANPVLFAEGVPNAAAAHASVLLGVRGSCQTIIGSRTAGLDAMALAALRIREGASQVVLVAASEEIHPTIDLAYATAQISPSTLRSFPGGCAFVVESAEHARARGAACRAEVDTQRWAFAEGRHMVAAMRDIVSALGTRVVLGTDGSTHLRRIETLGARRAGVEICHDAVFRTGEHFAATSLLVLADALCGERQDADARFGVVCADWEGSCVGLALRRGERTGQPSLGPVPAPESSRSRT